MDFLDVNHGAHGNRTAAGAVRIFDALGAQNLRTGREVRALDAGDESIQQLFVGGVRVLQEPLHTLGHLAQVVRGDVGRHTHGDTRGAVNQQVRDARGQNGRLERLAVIVRLEINGVLVDVAHHLQGDGGHLRLGVSGSRSTIVTGRAKVTLSQRQRVTHNPALNQTHEGVVDGAVAVGVELTHDVTDHAGALVESTVRAVTTVIHCVDDATVHGLKAVTDIRQGTTDDDGHRVVQVGALHFGLQVHLFDVTVVIHNLSVTGTDNVSPSHFVLLFFAHYFPQ